MSSREYVFTLNNPTALLDFSTCDSIRYAIYSEECGENGTNHFQGYLELDRPQRFTYIAKRVDGMEKAYFHHRNGDRDQARDYCRKTLDPTFVSGPYEYGTWNVGGQGTRVDIAAAMTTLKESGLKAVMEQHPLQFLKYHRGLETALSLMTDTRKRVTPEVIFHFGEPGTGKTHWIDQNEPDLYIFNNSDKWFDGFNGTSVLLLDDFYGQYAYSKLLRLLDKYAFAVEKKGGSIWIQSPRIYITSNTLPTEWYKALVAAKSIDIRALTRRIGKIRYFRGGWPTYGFVEYTSYEQFEESILRRSLPDVPPDSPDLLTL